MKMMGFLNKTKMERRLRFEVNRLHYNTLRRYVIYVSNCLPPLPAILTRDDRKKHLSSD